MPPAATVAGKSTVLFQILSDQCLPALPKEVHMEPFATCTRLWMHKESVKTKLTHQIVVVLHVWRAAVERLPLDAQDGVYLFRIHVQRAGGQAISEGLVEVMRHEVTPPKPPTCPHRGRQT